ncbi:Ba159 [Baboon cytomegalovirus]|nr:Ba159 [Baboon cytomegalovirus]
MGAPLVGLLTTALSLCALPALVGSADVTGKVHTEMLRSPEKPNNDLYHPEFNFEFAAYSSFREFGWAMCIDWESMTCYPIWVMQSWELRNATEMSKHPHDYFVKTTVFQTKESVNVDLSLRIQPMQRNVGLYVAYISFAKNLPQRFSDPAVDYARFALYLHTAIESQLNLQDVFKVEFHTFGIQTDPELFSNFVISNPKTPNLIINFTTTHGETHRCRDVKVTARDMVDGVVHEAIIKKTKDYFPWVRLHFSLYWKNTQITFGAVQYHFTEEQLAKPPPKHKRTESLKKQIYRHLEFLTRLMRNPALITVVLISLIGALLKRAPRPQ